MKTVHAVGLLIVLWAPFACDGPRATQGTSMMTAARREPWRSPFSAGQALTTEHYRIFSTAGAHAIRTYLPGFMEASYANYLKLTGLPDKPVAKPMPIYMLGTRREWAALTQSIFGQNSEALNVEAGGYCHRGICVFWEIGGTATFSVAAHEGMHQFFHHRLKGRLPMWLEEGLCTQAEGHRADGDSVLFAPENNPSRFSSLRDAIVNDRWISLAKLLPMDSLEAVQGGTERAVGYYGQLWALIQFIRSRKDYREGMERMLTDAVTGQFHVPMKVPAPAMEQLKAYGRAYNRTVSEPLFRYYISADLNEFDRQYTDFARKLAKLE
jgi:hypothetical protein